METRLYHEDPRRRVLEGRVTRCFERDGRPWAVLEQTILYPEGGGQPADRGTIGGVRVLDVQSVEGEILHLLEAPVAEGETRVELDWARRWDHMQQHSAQHLITALADARFGWPTTSFHLGDRVSDVELDAREIAPEHLRQLEEQVNEEIRAARPVRSRTVDADELHGLEVRSRGLPQGLTGPVRLVEIEGLDLNTCGGTHVASTAELGAVALLSAAPLRGGTRVRFVAGDRLLARLHGHESRCGELRRVLDAADEALADTARLKLEQLQQAQRTQRKLAEQLAATAADVLAASAGSLLLRHFPLGDARFLQQVAASLLARRPEALALLTGGEGEGGCFLLAAGEEWSGDLPALGQQVAARLDGRGGGRGRNFQGRANRPEAVLELRELLVGGQPT